MKLNSEATLLSLVNEVAHLTRVEADKRARIHGMTLAQWSLMIRLRNYPGLSQKELSTMMEVEPISVARMVDRLQAAGFVERRADANDRRIWRLHLLPAAEPLLAKMTKVSDGLREFVTQNLSPATHAAMLNGLTEMKTNLSKKQDAQAASSRRSVMPSGSASPASSSSASSSSASSSSASSGVQTGPMRETA